MSGTNSVGNPDFYVGMLKHHGATEELAPVLANGIVSMQHRGHFPSWPPNITRDGKRGEVLCEFCDAMLFAVSDPAPNEIGVSGDAVAIGCRHSADVEEWLDLFNEAEPDA